MPLHPTRRVTIRLAGAASTGLLAATVASCTIGPAPSPSGSTSSSSLPSASTASSASPATTSSPSPSPSPTLSRDAGWQAAIRALVDGRDRIHPNPWHGIDRATYVAAVEAAVAKVPRVTDDEALVELVRLAAMPSWQGRDGHTGVFPFIPGSGTHEYPVRWWQFSDGLVITAARAPYEKLVGSTVTAINGRPIADVLALVEPLAPRDNPSNLLAYGPLFLRVSELLAGLGVIDRAGPTAFKLTDRAGHASEVTLEPIQAEDDVAWNSGLPHRLPPRADALWLRDQAKAIWWQYLPERRTLYVQYNDVDQGSAGVADEVLARAKGDDVDRVVVDLRHNGGGDNTTYGRLLEVLHDPTINQPAHLYVLIGRVTFSAAANFATDLERDTAVTFAGEAMGGSPNQYGDTRMISLPGNHQTLWVASRYWERSTPDDTRITIEPEISAELSSADYFAGRDPVLEAVVEAVVGPG